jgi:polyferredoxin
VAPFIRAFVPSGYHAGAERLVPLAIGERLHRDARQSELRVSGVSDAQTRDRDKALRAIKIVHTIVWLFFVVCILAIPMASFVRAHLWAAVFALVVFVEIVVLVANRWRCPLTGVAAQYTDDRRDNFDIYLPEWLARHNKLIFGALYVLGIAYAAWRYWR